MWLKFLNFAKFCDLQDQGGQKSQIWAKFSTRLKFLDFANFYGSCKTRVFKNLRFEQNFQRDSFLDLAKFMVPARPEWSKISDLGKIFNVTQIS